jgi:hypothetical protein
LVAALVLPGCRSDRPPGAPPEGAPASTAASSAGPQVLAEAAVRPLPLTGPLQVPESEISGLAWKGDTLVVLPQFPGRPPNTGRPISHDRAGRTEAATGRVWGLSRSALERALRDTAAASLDPFPLSVSLAGIGPSVQAYQGCEAIAFHGQDVYVLVEAASPTAGMEGHLFRGRLTSGRDTTFAHVNVDQPIVLEGQTDLANMGFEALTLPGDTLVALYEANGAHVNPSPRAVRFDRSLARLPSVPFPALEYRVTDATAVDADGRFWVLNYFFPGERDKLSPAADSLVLRHGIGASHRGAEAVERLVEYRYTPRGIVRTDTPPIWLRLSDAGPRNWEGVVRFGDGFLIATDRFPRTLLAYVE